MLAVAAMAALIVALLNLVLAGTIFGAAWKRQRLLLSALAPAGVGLLAVAWCVILLRPESTPVLWPLSGALCLFAVTGFAIEAWLLLKPKTRRTALIGPALLTAGGGLAIKLMLPSLSWVMAFGAAFAASVVSVLAGMALWLQRHPDPAVQRFARHIALSIGVGSLLAASFNLWMDWGLHLRPHGGLPAWMAFIAELLFLTQVLNNRLDVKMALSRAVAYTGLVLLVGVISAIAFRRLGYPADLFQLSSMIGVALVATLLFVGLGDRISHRVESLLFPEHARLAKQLAASRGEHAALKRRLEQAERLAIAGELAASVAHEIKNPLAALRGYAELLSSGAPQVSSEWRPNFEKAVRIIREESDRIDARVAELLQSARTKDLPDRASKVDVNRLVLEAVSVMEQEPGIRAIHARLDPALPPATGSEEELRGALCNLLKNAAEAQAPTGGEIEVVTVLQGARVVVEIRDEGVGLDDVRVEQLFQPFHTTKARGTGLGLPIARSSIEAAGGSLSLVARTDRRGAVARIELLPGEGHE
jgi:signal transduction histidine kinase